MKFSIVLLILILSASALGKTCFKADRVNANLPESLCVYSYELELVIPQLPKLPFYQVKVSSSVGTLEEKANFLLARRSEVSISSTLVLREEDEGTCSRFYQSALVFEFAADLKGKVLSNSLTVTGVESENGDSCHTQPSETITSYTRL